MMPSLHARRLFRRLLHLALLSAGLTACEPGTAASSDATSSDAAPSDSLSVVACVGKAACSIVGEIECKTGGAETRVCSVDPLSGCLRWTAWAACPPAPDKCRTSVCQPGIGCGLQFVPCTDSNMCTIDSCTPETGCIFTQTQVLCDDGNPCTTDACTPAGCTNVPNAQACDDGNACTQKDRCSKGACVGGQSTACIAPDACHESGICDPSTGLCDFPVRPDGTACSDLQACTTGDVCIDGACVGTPTECKVGACSIGTCDPVTGLCESTPASDGSACNDGSACTQSDTCQDGICVGSSPVQCAAPGLCNVAFCDSATGECVTEALPNGSACSDGVACTVGDVCGAEGCEPGPCSLGFLCAGADPCACAPGYVGPGCSACAPGFTSTGELLVTSNVGFLPASLLSDSSVLVGVAGHGPYSINARLGLLADGSVFAASSSNPAHVIPPAALSGVTQLAAAFEHAIALKNDGSVIGWGYDYYGAHVVPPLPGPAVAVATGGSHSAVLLADGHVVLWGGSPTNPLPAPFTTSLAQGGFTAIAVGTTSNVAALKADGSVLTPHWPVTQTWTQVVAIAAGFNQVIALTSGGTVLAVGYSPYGESDVPAAAQSGVIAIAAAGHHSLALKADGSVVGWGRNYEGQLNLPVGPIGATRIFATGFASYIEIGGCELDNECVDGTAVCDPNATCVDTIEGYDCVCDPGFALVGTSCVIDCATAEPGTPCDDADPCTLSDACTQGTCGGTPVVCAVEGPCVLGASCQPDPETGYACVTTSAPDGSSCEDGDLCTTDDVCKKGGCKPGLPVLCPAGGDCQVDAACDSTTGGCVSSPAPDGTDCDDGAECTVGDTCQGGFCTGGACALNQDCSSAPACACAAGYVGPNCDACAAGFMAVSRPLEWGVAAPFSALNALTEGVTALHGNGTYRAALTASGAVIVDAELWNPLSWVPATAMSGVSKVVINGTHALALKNGGVIGWGNNGFTQGLVPVAANSGIIDIAVISNGALALKANGEVIGWGLPPLMANNFLMLLNGSPGPIARIEGARYRAAGLRPDGQVENYSLALAGTWTDIIAIEGGGGHLLGLDANGRVRCNGDNGYGQCVVPTSAETGVVAIAAGQHHSVALKADGTILTWGKGVPGAQVPPLLPVHPAGIAAAGDSSYALLQLCEDIDECATGQAECSPLATCTNTVGSYTCTCVPPYVGNGFECALPGCEGAANGTLCDDGDPCTLDDVCTEGACGGAPVVCAIEGPCVIGASCQPDPETGYACVTTFALDGSSCEDGDLCTADDLCKKGDCKAGMPVLCPVGAECELDAACDSTTGECVGTPSPDGTSCDDGAACSVGDTCEGGLCTPGPCALNQDCTALPSCGCADGYVGPGCDECAPGFMAISRPIEWGVAPPFTALNSIAEGVTALHGAANYRAALTTSGAVILDVDYWFWTPVTWVPAAAQSGVSKVVINATHALALKNGGVIAWGSNGHGQTTVPVAATTGVIDIAILTNSSLALLDTGEVIGWGQLVVSGYVNSLNGSVGPISRIEGARIRSGGLRPDGRVENVFLAGAGQWLNIVAIEGGGGHLLGLDATGRVRCDGDNGYGQCTVPAAAETGVVAIAAGQHHSVALKADGTVITWGKGVPGAQVPPLLPALPAGIDAAGDSSYAMLQLCEDIDECATGQAECSPNAVCTNTVGSYTCTCLPPYVGNGFECALGGCDGAADGTLCDDDDRCTETSTCQAGACVGVPLECPSAGPCEKAGVCNPATGICEAPTAAPDGVPCDDGDLCTKGDICKAGKCRATAIPCGAPGPCQAAGVCDPSTGLCSFTALPDGSLCSDGDPCTSKDACKAGECAPGTALVCPAAGPCQDPGVCKTEGDLAVCVPGPTSPDGTPCDDDDLCTDKDGCKSGTCVGVVRQCNPSEPCLVKGTCNPDDGKCSFPPALDGTPCDDGDVCTESDKCKLGTCQPGTLVCD